MSDHQAWLEEWCPECRAAPGARCGHYTSRRGGGGRMIALARLHVARGWRGRRCPACKALPGERCRTPTGREASRIHTARLVPGRAELVRPAVWDELGRRDATIAVVPFSGRAGRGGQTEVIRLARCEAGELVDVQRWTSRDELCYALEAPVWDRYGTFAGHPLITGIVTWSAEEQLVVISGTRGDVRFEEIVS